MGYTTSISDYELERGDGNLADDDNEGGRHSIVKSKVVTVEEKAPPVSTTAVTKDV